MAAGCLCWAAATSARGGEWRRAEVGARDALAPKPRAAIGTVAAGFEPFERPRVTPAVHVAARGGAGVVLNSVTSAAWRQQGEPRGERPAPQPQRAEEFDPFEEVEGDGAAAANAADEQLQLAPANPGRAAGEAAEFDPFEEDQTAEASDEPSIGHAPNEDAGGQPDVGTADDDDGVESEAFDVQDAFDAPRGTAVGPSVEDELEEAGQAVEDEIIRREEEGPEPPTNDADETDPFSPEDAADAPPRRPEESFPEPEPDDDDEIDPNDLDDMLQQPDGFDIRPLNQSGGLTPEQRAEREQQLEAERLENERTCGEFLAAVKADNIRTVSLDIRMHGTAGEDYPFDCGLGDELFQPRTWAETTYLWKAAALCNKPLYFEQVQMERYGHSWGPILDPVVSGAHFFGTFPIWPYKMGILTPNECVYTLGYYRPGSCAPYMIPAVPFTWRAAAFETGAWTAGSFVIP